MCKLLTSVLKAFVIIKISEVLEINKCLAWVYELL